jgi:hypothetical protein
MCEDESVQRTVLQISGVFCLISFAAITVSKVIDHEQIATVSNARPDTQLDAQTCRTTCM